MIVPTLVFLCEEVPGIIEVNNTVAGEVCPGEPIVLPISPNANYYVTFIPIVDSPNKRYYPITRKLVFFNGELVLPLPMGSELKISRWPGSLYSLTLSPGVLNGPPEKVFPYTIDRLTWQVEGKRLCATLFYDNATSIAVEEGGRILFGRTLMDASAEGSVREFRCGKENLLAAKCMTLDGSELLVLGYEQERCKVLLELSGHAFEFEDADVALITPLGTLLGHELKQVYSFDGKEFKLASTQKGCFTHPLVSPLDGAQTIRAFMDAIREGLAAEAMGYLSEPLRRETTFEALAEFFGEFNSILDPLCGAPGDGELQLGLSYPKADNFSEVRLFSFELNGFGNGSILNVGEC